MLKCSLVDLTGAKKVLHILNIASDAKDVRFLLVLVLDLKQL